MAKIHVVVDSTANLPAKMLAKYPNLHIVPLTVRLGDQQWREQDLSNAELFRLIEATKCHPKTSQPSPGDFLQVFQPLSLLGAELIVITIACGLSGTVQSAKVAAGMAGGVIRVVDSGTTAAGIARMALIALNMAQNGASAVEIAVRLQAISRAAYTMFVPETLEYLHKGGRLGAATALLGSILQIRPVLILNEGQVTVLDKVRTKQRALDRMLEEIKQRGEPAAIDIVHIERLAEAEGLKNIIAKVYPEAKLSVGYGGSVLGAHLGPGIIGLIVYPKI